MERTTTPTILSFFYDFCFFFKQKTAYEIMPSLVGSEMCIRDRAKRKSEEVARSLLAEAGYPDGRELGKDGPLTLSLIHI